MSVDEMLENHIHESWNDLFNNTMKEKLEEIFQKLEEKYGNLPNPPYQPTGKAIFNVFTMNISKIKVVILGQDPYPTEGYAMGYAFAVPEGKEMQKSLKNIEEVIKKKVIKKESDLANHLEPEWKTLKYWIEGGVFLLNTALTVEKNNAGSSFHLKLWEEFTKEVIKYIISKKHPYLCIWMLWGKDKKKGAQRFEEDIKKYIKDIEEISTKDGKNYILKAPHPAVPNNSFRECGYKNFLDANEILLGEKEIIKW